MTLESADNTRPDAACMARIHEAAYVLDRPWSLAEFTQLVQSPHSLTLGDQRAFVLARIIADEAEVLTIATHPDHRRTGLARNLLERFHEAARTRGAVTAFLEVAADNDAAITLYQGCGYTQVGARRAYYPRSDGPPANALIMRRQMT
jgi:[ribosomal protein S18]-alanine N-acetyltransferase